MDSAQSFVTRQQQALLLVRTLRDLTYRAALRFRIHYLPVFQRQLTTTRIHPKSLTVENYLAKETIPKF